MNNGDKPASPVYDPQAPAAEFDWVTGLTKREAFAMAAMQGLLASTDETERAELYHRDAADEAVKYADALLAALEAE